MCLGVSGAARSAEELPIYIGPYVYIYMHTAKAKYSAGAMPGGHGEMGTDPSDAPREP